jgi:signal transduction histidine kinase
VDAVVQLLVGRGATINARSARRARGECQSAAIINMPEPNLGDRAESSDPAPMLPEAHVNPRRSGPFAAQVTNPMENENASIWSSWQSWAIVVGVTVALGVLGVLNDYVSWVATRQHPASGVFWRELPGRFVHVPLVPLVWYLASRFRLDGSNRVRNAAIHLAFSIALVYPRMIAASSLSALFSAGRADPFLASAGHRRLLFTTYFVWYWAIAAAYYAFEFYRQSQRQLRRAAQLEARLAEVQLQALRSQLNPHFLFNTLNAVTVLALQGDGERVVNVVERLCNLLRVSLDERRPDIISLAEELRFIDEYLEIQYVRFGDRLMIRRDLAAETLDALVPAMLLQPIVENAIKHGISTNVGSSTVTIRSVRDGSSLRLQVTDSGPGFTRAAGRRNSGIGLSTTRTRLEELYGRAHSIDCRDGANGGGVVTIAIPFSRMGPGTEIHSRADRLAEAAAGCG